MRRFKILGLVGPRQSGKTTLLKDVLPNYGYVNLEDVEMQEYAERDPKGFLKSNSAPLIIDEAQRSPRLFSQLQVEVDGLGKNGGYVLSGSQNFLMMEKISQSLAGRIGLQTLLPLSWSEVREGSARMGNYAEFITRGQYPALYEDKRLLSRAFYSSYVATYIERDLRQIINVMDLSSFQRFLKLCAGRVGQELNLSSLAQDAGITHNTAKAWLSVLESSYIVYLLQPYYKNFNKRLVKSPKLYFYDSGLVTWLLNIETAMQLETHYARGALFENLVITEYLKNRYNQGEKLEAYFWRDKGGREIDLILDREKLIGIEIKAGQTVNEDYFMSLRAWKEVVGEAELRVVYGGEGRQEREDLQVFSWREMNRAWK